MKLLFLLIAVYDIGYGADVVVIPNFQTKEECIARANWLLTRSYVTDAYCIPRREP